MLLLLADRQILERLPLERALAGAPETRRLLALTLARVPLTEGLPLLERLSVDPDSEVRRVTAFALGRIGNGEAVSLLRGLVSDPDPEVGSWAVHGLARAGRPLREVAERLAGMPTDERLRRLLPDLHLFAGESRAALAASALGVADPWLRRRAAFVLAQSPRRHPPGLYRRLLADADAGVRSLAAAGLGAVGGRDELEALRLLVATERRAPVLINALAAARTIVAEGRSAASERWRAVLLTLLDDPRPALRRQALVTSGQWLLDEELGPALVRFGRTGEPGERIAALAALAWAGHPEAGDLALVAASDPDPRVRAQAARVAAKLGASALQAKLSRDPAATVREAVLVSRADAAADRQALLSGALHDPDPGVRAAGLRLLATFPVLPFEELVTAIGAPAPRLPELRLAGIEALTARGLVAASERGAVVAVLERLAEASSFSIRSRAIAALGRMGRPRPEAGPAVSGRTVGDYRSIVVRTRRPLWLRLETERGALVMRIDCATAPLSCLSFSQLVAQGYFDGTRVDRVEPGRWLEAGAPREDGLGGPGFELRDEPAPRRFVPGVVGLVRPAAHAAGSRFFVLFAEAPELEGTHTPLGEVVLGLEILPDLTEGTVVVSLKEIAGPPLDP